MRFGTWIRDWLVPLQLLGIMIEIISPAAGDCCPSKNIVFQLVDVEDDCSLYDAKTVEPGACKAAICNDGTVVVGSYCGQGSCNIFGCRCQNGCRKGDAVQTFRDFYGDYHISNAHLI